MSSPTTPSPVSDASTIVLRESQKRVLQSLKEFASPASSQRVFILRGYAGTGKTTLMRFLIEYLSQKKIGFELLASTGRAAKVLSDAICSDRLKKNSSSAIVAQTIHSCIYQYKGFNRSPSEDELNSSLPNAQLNLVFTATQIGTRSDLYIYVIDEASMVSDHTENPSSQATFGSGQLLSDLLAFDSNRKAKFLFVGDPCQLPPVGEVVSPALDEYYFSPKASVAELTEIIRQKDGGDLIRLAHTVRSHVASAPESAALYGSRKVWAQLNIGRNQSVVKHSSRQAFLSHYVEVIEEYGYDKVVCICRSNKDVNACNQFVRQSLGHLSPLLPEKGELLMVVQNNLPTGIVNGDFVSVESCGTAINEKAGLHFVDVEVKERSSGSVFKTKLLLDTLVSDQPNLSQSQQSALFIDFFIRMKNRGIKQHSDSFNHMLRVDPYLNALRCNYGYAVTCHKAQGGEWDKVFLSLPRNIMLNPTQQSYRWLYTAITRAKQELHLVNDFYIK